MIIYFRFLKINMSRADTAFAVVTSFWGVVGIVCPILVQFFMFRSPNKGYHTMSLATSVITGKISIKGAINFKKNLNKNIDRIVQIMLVMTAACCYLFWLCAFLFQLNPLLGPQLESNLIRVMQAEWGGINPLHEPPAPHE